MDLKDIISSSPEAQINSLDIDSDKIEVQKEVKILAAQRYYSDTKDRKWLALWTALIVTIWLLAVLMILVFNEIFNMKLTENVLITLLSTTTLNVLGLSFIVLKGHFNGGRQE